MKIEYYNPKDEKKSCIYRAISKALDRDYMEIKKELDLLKEKLNTEDSQLVFETYLFKNNYKANDKYKDYNLFDVDYSGVNVVFCNDNDWYHLVCIIDNVLYDKKTYDDLKDMNIIRIYTIDN